MSKIMEELDIEQKSEEPRVYEGLHGVNVVVDSSTIEISVVNKNGESEPDEFTIYLTYEEANSLFSVLQDALYEIKKERDK